MQELSCLRQELSGNIQFMWFHRKKVVRAPARYTTHTTNIHNHSWRWWKWPPYAPNEASSPSTTCQVDGLQPPEQAGIILGGVRGFMALKALLCSDNDALPQHQSILMAIHPLNLQKFICSCSEGLPPSSNDNGAGRKASCGAQGVISAGIDHGWLWLRWSLLAVGCWWHHIFVIPT